MTRPIRYDLSGIGSMVVDSIHRVPKIIGADEKGLLSPYAGGEFVRRFVGGVTLNHLGWASLLGLGVAVFGKQADDPEGRLLRAGMRRLGVRPELDLSARASSSAQVYVDPEGARSIYMSRGGTAEVTVDDVELLHRDVIERSATVSTEISQLPLAAVRRVLELARGAGARTVLDFDVPISDAVPMLGTEEELYAVLRLADLVKPSLAATRGLVSAQDPREAAREMAERFGVDAVAITTGTAGCFLYARGRTFEVPACTVNPIDTTGAGDAFLGGLLAGLHHSLDWEDAARLGNACGACCCERLGAFPDDPEPLRARVLELYAGTRGAPFECGPSSIPVDDDPLDRFLSVVAQEVDAVARSVDRAALEEIASLISEAEEKGGRIHVTGVGKPEHVARYAAALFSSTGTPATFLDATEGVHGSVGQLRSGDVLIAISKSGETEETIACVAAAQGMEARTVVLCGDPDSRLARQAEILLRVVVADEGGPLGLVPRASFLAATLAIQALSVLLQSRRGLTQTEYHRRHPAGALGRLSS